MTLFDDEVSPELVRSLKSLETAQEDLGVPWPYDQAGDMLLLTRIKIRYPELDVAALVDDFLIWCADARPWEDDRGKKVTIRWKSRLWTRARNQIQYAKTRTRGKKTTHHVAIDHQNDDGIDEVLDEW